MKLLLLPPSFALLALAAVQDPAQHAPETAARLDPAAIDRMFEAGWAAAGLKPAPPATDADWLRRASLALNGVIPTADDALAFSKDNTPEKRSKKVDELLASPDYAEQMGGEWMRALIGRGGPRQRYNRGAFEDWTVEQFAKNVPFDRFATEVIAATGTAEKNPAVGFIERWDAEPKDLAGATSKAFLGIRIECARCHDHKYEQWKQEDFNQFAAYFATTKRKVVDREMKPATYEIVDEPERRMNKYGKEVVRKALAKNPERMKKEIERQELAQVNPQPLRAIEKGVFAQPLESVQPPATEPESEAHPDPTRRRQLAEWLTTPGNPFFSRAVANRAFSILFGYALANPVDDFRSDSALLVPGLLDALATELERSRYDYKALVGMLAKTKAFSLASAVPIFGGKPDKHEVAEANEKAFARFPSRPMSAEQLFESVIRTTGIDEAAEVRAKKVKKLGKKGEEMGEAMAKNYGRLRDQALRKFFTTFEDDEQGEEIDFEGTIPQALLMMNGRQVNDGIAKGMTLTRTMEKNAPVDRVDWLYLSTLSRKPTNDERMKALGYLQKHGDKREAYEDLAWALLNSAEYSTVH